MKRYILAALMVPALVIALSACSSDEALQQAEGNASGGAIRFSLTGDGRAKTRTETQLDREKAVTSVIAVAFNRSTAKFATWAQATDISEEVFDGDWRADLGTPDLYDVYFIANADAALKTALGTLTAGTSTKDDFFALEATQSPGTSTTDGAFLMTSEEVNVDVDSDPDGTLLGSTVTVTRASARIDIQIDDDVLASVSNVTLKNRYTSTKVARIGADASMDGLDSSDESYTVNLTGDDKELTGTIYAYEDPTQSSVLVITGKLDDGTDVAPAIRFDSQHENVALQRNYLYTIRLSRNTDPADVGDVDADIIVKDWQTGDVITQSHTTLASRTAPTFEIAASGTGWTYDSGTTTVTLSDNTQTSFDVTVTNTGSTLSKVVCKNQVEGFTVAEGARSTGADGKPVQTFTVTILANGTDEPARSFTFAVENLLDADATGTGTFTVDQPAGPTS